MGLSNMRTCNYRHSYRSNLIDQGVWVHRMTIPKMPQRSYRHMIVFTWSTLRLWYHYVCYTRYQLVTRVVKATMFNAWFSGFITFHSHISSIIFTWYLSSDITGECNVFTKDLRNKDTLNFNQDILQCPSSVQNREIPTILAASYNIRCMSRYLIIPCDFRIHRGMVVM